MRILNKLFTKNRFKINIECVLSTRVFKKKVPTFVLLLPRLPKHLEMCFCTFFNSQAFAEIKNNKIYIIALKFEKLLTKM